MATQKINIKPHLALLATNLFFAINFTAVKHLINQHLIQPFGLNLSRMLVTTLMLWVLYLISPVKQKIQPIHYKRFLICALMGITINQLLFIKGLSMTHSIHASLLMLTTPIFITVLAFFFFKENITTRKILGLILGVAGAAILILGRNHQQQGMNVWMGDLLVMINAACYSYYFILVKPLMKRYHPITVLRIVFTIGTIIALPVCWGEFVQTPWNSFSHLDLGVLLFICTAGTFFAYLFNIYGIKHLGASVSGSYIYTQPVFAALIAVYFNMDQFDLYKLIAACSIFSGVYLITQVQSKSITEHE